MSKRVCREGRESAKSEEEKRDGSRRRKERTNENIPICDLTCPHSPGVFLSISPSYNASLIEMIRSAMPAIKSQIDPKSALSLSLASSFLQTNPEDSPFTSPNHCSFNVLSPKIQAAILAPWIGGFE